MHSSLYFGKVMHCRKKPLKHRFTYSVFSLLIDLDELKHLDRNIKLFSYNRFNVLSFYDNDHGGRDGKNLKNWAMSMLGKENVFLNRPSIRLLSFPRVFGYVFNPLSVYYCYDGGYLRALIYEVKNTFGGQHCYIFDLGDSADGRSISHECDKQFYVSPFMDVSGSYRFKATLPDEHLALSIDFRDRVGNAMVAVQTGKKEAVTDATLARHIIRCGLLTAKVTLGIHFEALRLWIKGAVYYGKRLYPSHKINPKSV